jgi:ribosomal protein S19
MKITKQYASIDATYWMRDMTIVHIEEKKFGIWTRLVESLIYIFTGRIFTTIVLSDDDVRQMTAEFSAQSKLFD